MTNVHENGTLVPRELEFWGKGKAADIKKGFAITSIRKPGTEPDFKRGESILAYCRDDQQKVPVIIIGNDQKPLNKYTVPQLALDGFFSPEQAAEGLKIYPGYEETTPDSTMQLFTFVDERLFNVLPSENRQELLTQPIQKLVKKPNFRHLFFPTMCFWLADRGGTIDDWLGFLKTFKLASKDELKAMREFNYVGTNMYEFLTRHPEQLIYFAQASQSRAFEPIILALFR